MYRFNAKTQAKIAAGDIRYFLKGKRQVSAKNPSQKDLEFLYAGGKSAYVEKAPEKKAAASSPSATAKKQ